MGNSGYRDWNRIYREYPAETLPWELGRPRKTLVDLIESDKIQPGNALDLCCGVGANSVYMAEKGFKVAAIDVSERALRLARQKAREAEVETQFCVSKLRHVAPPGCGI